MQIEKVTEVSEDGLTSREWGFCPIETGTKIELVLNSYTEYERPTTRHKFRESGVRYYRLIQRNSNTPLEEIELPDWVVSEALQSFISKIIVVKEFKRCV